MLVSYAIFTILYLIIATYLGLYIGGQIQDPMKYKIFLGVYVIINIAILNVILLANFWATLQHKSGPPGAIGMKGDIGEIGDEAICGELCKNKECVKSITDTINDIYKDLSNDNDASIKNKFIAHSVNKMCNSKEYEVLATTKGAKNLIDYISNIWKDWIKQIYNSSNNGKFLNETHSTPYDYNWNNNLNPFSDIQKYDIYHWGRSQEFRGIGIGVCQNVNASNYFPKYDKPAIQLIETNNYNEIFRDTTQNTSKSISVWEPKKIIWCNGHDN